MDSGNFAWAIAATALVLFMTPGVAFFYGGLVKAKSVVSMMMMSFGALGLVSVLWILYGFNMSAIGDGNPFLAGNPFSDFGLQALSTSEGGSAALVGATFGATFAIITVALISGAIADRAKFGSWLVFAGLFATLVYFPVSAWVWGGGWIMQLGEWWGTPSVIDYAGGTAVHINAGAAAHMAGRSKARVSDLRIPKSLPMESASSPTSTDETAQSVASATRRGRLARRRRQAHADRRAARAIPGRSPARQGRSRA